MKLILESDNLDIVDIPDSPQGNYWIKDGTRNVLNVESKDNNWVIKSNQDVNIYKNIFDNSKREQEVILKNYDYYYLAENTHNKGFSRLFILPSYEIMDNIVVDFNKVNQLVIGKNDNSDIVIENDNLENIDIAFKFAKKTRRIILENLIGIMILKITFMILSLFGFVNMWLAIFSDVGLCVISIINSMRASYVGKSNDFN